MLKTRENTNLTLEPLLSEGGIDFSVENLDRDVAIVPRVLCEKDGSHPAATDLPQDLITTPDLVLKPLQ